VILLLTRAVWTFGCMAYDDARNAAMGSRSSLKDEMKKTKICYFFQNGRCKYGSQCSFAHSSDELQSVPEMSKMVYCTAFKQGICKDRHCKYAHGNHDVKAAQTFYKKKLCPWNEKGGCFYGASCKYAHGEAEMLRARYEAPKADFFLPAEVYPPPCGSSAELGPSIWPVNSAGTPAAATLSRQSSVHSAVPSAATSMPTPRFSGAMSAMPRTASHASEMPRNSVQMWAPSAATSMPTSAFSGAMSAMPSAAPTAATPHCLTGVRATP